MVSAKHIRLSASVGAFIEEESQLRFPYETGGILIGQCENRILLVTHASGPGPKANHHSHHFVRDGDYSQEILDNIFRVTGGGNDYVGEWHSHPLPSRPSQQDRESMRWISNNPSYHQKYPIMIICQKNGHDRWTLQGYQWFHLGLIPLQVIIEDI